MKRIECSRKITAAAMTCALVLSVSGLAACSNTGNETQTVDQRITKAQASHSGRYETSGSHGCYGCHGSNSTAWPILTSAPKLPAFHFSVDSPSSFNDLKAEYQDCASCHIEITGVQNSSAKSES